MMCITIPAKFFRAVALLTALACLAKPALAETTASVYLGSSHAASSDISINQPGTNSIATFHDVNWNSDSFNNPYYYGIRISHFFEQHNAWGIGFDYTHDKVFAQTDQRVQVNGTWNGAPINVSARIDQRVQSFNISHGVNIFALNVYRRWKSSASNSLLCSQCVPYVGAGPTWYVLHPENTVNGQHNNESYMSGGFGYQLLAGLQYEISPRLGAFIETKYNSGRIKVDIAGGSGKTTLDTTQLLAGLNVTF